MKQFKESEVLRLIRPTWATYDGLGNEHKERIRTDYKEARKFIERYGVSIAVSLRLNTLIKELAEEPEYLRKSIMINAVKCNGFDGWKRRV